MTTPPRASADGLIHATVVARHGPPGWRGVLIGGGSGAGKSDLALRLIAGGWRLIADDYAWVWQSGGRLYACAPASIAGVIEARGVGLAPTAFGLSVRLSLSIVCVGGEPERMPDSESHVILGAALPLVRLNPLHASSAQKTQVALAAALAGETP